LVAAPYFIVDIFELKEPHDFSTRDASGKDSAQILVAVEGCGMAETEGRAPVTLAKGDAMVIPAALERFTVRPQWTVEFLKACVPGTQVPEPATRL
jgi:mannose-6-phosphate isomerase class I